MNEAIKILELALESQNNLVSFRVATENGIITESELLPDTNAERKAEIQAAIEVLQRKVKKDPRVDGLPDFEPDGLSRPLIIWVKNGFRPLMGRLSAVSHIWYVQDYIDTMEYTTDDILFYCNPDDIV